MKRLTALSFGTRQPEDSQKTRLTYSTERSENTNRQSFIHVNLCLCIRNRRAQTLVARFKASHFKGVRDANPAREGLDSQTHTRSHRVETAHPTRRRARTRRDARETERFNLERSERVVIVASRPSRRRRVRPARLRPRPDSSPSENLVVHHPRRVASTLSNTYVSSRPGGLVTAVRTALLRHLRVLKQTYSRRRRRLTSSSVSIFPARERAMFDARCGSRAPPAVVRRTIHEKKTRRGRELIQILPSRPRRRRCRTRAHTYLSTRVRERRSRRVGASLLNSSGEHSFLPFGHLSSLKYYTVFNVFTFVYKFVMDLTFIA